MDTGIKFTSVICKKDVDDLTERIEALQKLQEQNKLELTIMIASAPEHGYDEFGIFKHKDEYIKEKVTELWNAITKVECELTTMYLAVDALLNSKIKKNGK